VIGLVALYFILRIVSRGMVDVAFVIDVLPMNFDDFSSDPPSFRIPAHPITNFEHLDHCSFLKAGQCLADVRRLSEALISASGNRLRYIRPDQRHVNFRHRHLAAFTV
jgi:hypothetical protein